jgi:hypothetical protein
MDCCVNISLPDPVSTMYNDGLAGPKGHAGTAMSDLSGRAGRVAG